MSNLSKVLSFVFISALAGSAAAAADETASVAENTVADNTAVETSAVPFIFEASLDKGIDEALKQTYQQALQAKFPQQSFNVTDTASAAAAISKMHMQNGRLIVTYDESRISSDTAGSYASSWSGLETPVLCWLADVKSGTLTANGSDDPFAAQLISSAAANKFKIIFPLMDIDEVQAINANTVLTNGNEALQQASKRYDAKFIIVAAKEDKGDSADFKWSIYDSQGRSVGSSSISGGYEFVASKSAGQMAKSLAEFMPSMAASSVQTGASGTGGDKFAIGPGPGNIKVKISGVDNILDIKKIISTIIIFGYESDVKLLSYDADGCIFRIATASSPLILDGTMANSGEFSKTGPWTYHWNNSSGVVKAARDGVGPADSSRVVSHLSGNRVIAAPAQNKAVQEQQTAEAEQSSDQTDSPKEQ